MAPLRIGVMGCAAIARRRMLPAIVAAPDAELSAIASRDVVRAERFTARFGGRALSGYAALLADERTEAVYLPLPAGLHAEWVEAALLAGKHVLAEKPLTTRCRDTVRLLDLAATRGLVLMENVMFVHHAQHAEVRRLLAAGAIGEPRAFRAAFTVPRLPEGDIRYRPELAGGALWDTAVYPVRAALHILGPDLRVVGAVRAAASGFRVDTGGTALLATPDGVGAHLTYGLDHGYRSVYEVHGSAGWIAVEPAFTPAAEHPPVLRLVTGAGCREVRLPPDDQVANTVAAFVAAARGPVRPSHEPVVNQACLLDAIRRQAAPAHGRGIEEAPETTRRNGQG